MVDQSYGLRFDIYERIHLGDDVIGIDELEEIELFPKVQVIPGEEYASLRGHLLLTGVYRGGDESQQLEHYIPVEITIPLSRVNALEDIAVEIENFDVDVLNSRSLNVTGVLLLQGIETSVPAVSEDWRDQEFTAAHDLSSSEQREQYPGIEDAASTSYAADEQQEVSPEDTHVLGEAIEGDNKANEGQDAWAALAPSVTEDTAPDLPTAEAYISNYQSQAVPEQLKWDNSLITSTGAAEEAQQVSTQVPFEAVSASADESAINVEQDVPVFQAGSESELVDSEEATVSSSVEEVVQEEKPELKIALGSKKTSAQEAVSSFSISNLLPKHRSLVESEVAEQEEVGAEPTLESDVEDRTSWKSLFIRQSEDQAPFRKMKLVIVQREETLNDIAERYHLSTRELQLYNRLEEHHLAEGQVLYIP